MNPNKYTMTGKDGNLRLTVNNKIIAYADSFVAVLHEYFREFAFRGASYAIPSNYEIKLKLYGLSQPHPDVVDEIIRNLSYGELSDFVFKGFYKLHSGDLEPIEFHWCVPVKDDLSAFLDGYVSEWEFVINYITDKTVDAFKKAA